VVAPAVLAAWLLAGCGDAPGEMAPAMKDKEPTGVDQLATSSGDDGAPAVPGDACDSAPVVVAGALTVSLKGATAELEGGDVDGLTCTFDGPDTFFRHVVGRRADVRITARGAGFTPTVAILGSGCADAFACAKGLPAAMLDVAAGTELVFAIGIGADEPVLATAGLEDDLAVSVELELREVIAAGDTCGLLGQGRCETGSACLPDEDGGSRCTSVDGDTCSTATPVEIAFGSTLVAVDPSRPYGDAHQHPCTGARRREVVMRVQWPATAATLTVSTLAPDVGLAVRGPGCAATEALGCAQPGPSGASVSLDTSGAGSAFVFVELPVDDLDDDDSELGPFEVAIALAP